MGIWMNADKMMPVCRPTPFLTFIFISLLLFSSRILAQHSEPHANKANEDDPSLHTEPSDSQQKVEQSPHQTREYTETTSKQLHQHEALKQNNEHQQQRSQSSHQHESNVQNGDDSFSHQYHQDNLEKQDRMKAQKVPVDQDDSEIKAQSIQQEEFNVDQTFQSHEDVDNSQEPWKDHEEQIQYKYEEMENFQPGFQEADEQNIQSDQVQKDSYTEAKDEALLKYERYLKELEEREKIRQLKEQEQLQFALHQHDEGQQNVPEPDKQSRSSQVFSSGPDMSNDNPDNVEEVLDEKKEMTPEEIEGERLYQEGEKLINATYYKEYKEAYLYFLKAAELNHVKAKAYVAYGMLFGDYMPQNITKASEIFKELAEVGFPKSQMGLAFMYSAGIHFNSSQAKALIYLTFGALGGDAFAQMALGYRYYAGIGVESKCETALTYYRKVATNVAESVTFAGGPMVQRVRLQEESESQGNNSPLLDDDLLQYYHFLADKGDQQAQIVLGTLYYQGGKGVQINHEQAYHYFSTAAESGNAHALGYLGKMHSEGSPFVEQSNQTALEYFKQSADKNNHVGQAGLGMIYLKGLGIEKDTNKAFRYFSLASDQGSVDGQLQLGIMYFTGSGIRKDYKMAVKYFTLASQNGHVLAYFNLAQMHATGTGVLRNCHTAVELFKNVAERGRWSEMLMDAHRMYQHGNLETALIKYMFLAELGYEVAQSNVAYILDNGIISKFEKHEMYQRALLQYSRAAVQGSTHARIKIGDYHYYGCGTEVDYESAASHYRMASEQQRNAQAMFNLGYMHERGLGMKQDVHLAKRFYDMAAETSIDAHIPVTLALLKLGLFYGVDVFSKEFEGLSRMLEAIDPQVFLGSMWDVYLACSLVLAFTGIYLLRRMR